ncbi:hypothetical protein [Rufibacter aurantiacus]|uniref:hypothetical protein n=1 Tax=Rufibacter aurantiacus TaxID=2817374 RepID=UPI001B3013FF|nr:hypothetical protein [Rufibacter aurantiacus]
MKKAIVRIVILFLLYSCKEKPLDDQYLATWYSWEEYKNPQTKAEIYNLLAAKRIKNKICAMNSVLFRINKKFEGEYLIACSGIVGNKWVYYRINPAANEFDGPFMGENIKSPNK